MLRAAALGLVLLVGCATGESLDEGNGAGGAPAGGGGAAGSAVQGGGGTAATTSGGGNAGAGATSTGGGTGGATTGGTGGGDDGGLCPLDQKNCQGTCVPLKNPYTGCSNPDCKECPSPPANATSICTTGLCDFKCNGGYTKSGSSCVSSGGGGGTGGTTSGGGGTTSGGGGTTASGGGGTGGGTCKGPCNPSDPAAHILCAGICAFSGQSIGLCAPILNCCLCSS